MNYPFVNIHTHKACSHGVCIVSHSLGEGYSIPAQPYSAGIHPWAVQTVDIEEALQVLMVAEIVAVGEIGLDFAVTDADRSLQIEVFEAQLKIAAMRNLPVIIHCVRAQNETLEILSKYRLKSVIFHSYIGSREQAKQIIKLGYYISFSNSSLHSSKTIESMLHIPLENLFLETDAQEIDIAEIYALAATELNVTEELLKEKIYKNYKTIFE